MDEGRHCAICCKSIRKDVLCRACRKKWCTTANGETIYPNWVQALIRIENRNYYISRFIKEVPLENDI